MRRFFIYAVMAGLFLYAGGCSHTAQKIDTADETTQLLKQTAALHHKIRKSPGEVSLRIQLGMLLLRTEQYSAARAQFDTALTLHPEMPAAKFGRAEANFLLGQTRAGIKEYLDVLNSPEADQYTKAIAERIGAPYAIRAIISAPGENMMARFSADGRFIVFQSNRDGNWEIYRALPDGAQPYRLTNNPAVDESPSFSPDGQTVVFVRAQSKNARDIYLLELPALENEICIAPHAADDWNPVFSPKGDYLAFASDRDAAPAGDTPERQSDIFLFSLADSSLKKFSQGFGNKSAPCFTPDGAALLYVNNVNGVFDIFEQTLGDNRTLALVTKSSSKGSPQISPDGKSIVYFEKREQNLDLFLFDRAGNRTQRLTVAPSVEAFPVFSPDGNEIFFTSNRDGGYQIYAMDLRMPISRPDLIAVLEQLLIQQNTRHNE